MEKTLFTPGPLSVSITAKQAGLQDVSSRDTEFTKAVKFIRERLVTLADVSLDDYTCVLLQGSGSNSVEAVLCTSIPRKNEKVLILENGVYSKRMAQMCEYLGVNHRVVSFPDGTQVQLDTVEKILEEDKSWTNICVVHHETSTGVLNRVDEIGELIEKYCPGAFYIVDCMSSFGAIPLSLKTMKADFMISSANKCLQGVPGFSYAIARISSLQKCKGRSRSFSFDLVSQWEAFKKTGQFRFTPATNALLTFKQALVELEEEGGILMRSKRYQATRNVLRDGMRSMGFKELLDDSVSGHVMTCYVYPEDKNFDVIDFFTKLEQRGKVIYVRKVLTANTFIIANMGHVFADDMRSLLVSIREVCTEMGMTLPNESKKIKITNGIPKINGTPAVAVM